MLNVPHTRPSSDQLRAGLDAADPATLMLVLVHLTGEREWLERARPHLRGPMSYQEFMPEELRRAIRDRLYDVLSEGGPFAAEPDDALLREMMSVAAGEPMSESYIAMMREDLNLDSLNARALRWRNEPSAEAKQACDVLIIGAGMSGIFAGIQLQQAGIPFRILEKNETVGGTWFENTYPGCGVDTPNHFYSFAGEPNHEWSHFFAKRNELWQYFERVTDKYGLRKHISFRTEVTEAAFDQASARWHVTVRRPDGSIATHAARILVSAAGILNRPRLPDIPGRDSFKGPAFHTAEWDKSFDWKAKRVAMIGTGASGHQVGPAIQPDVARLMIFQRSPHWAVPNPNYFLGVSDGKKWALANIPTYLRWYRFQLFWGFADGLHAALQRDPDWPTPDRSLNEVNERHRIFMERHIRKEIGDDRPDLLEKAIPPYPPYGKRILIDNHWFRMLTRPNVDLITDRIAAIEPDGIRMADGKLWECDAIVYATGFLAMKMLHPMKITGREGREIHEVWGDDDARAYLGITVPAFPNFFMLVGPNTGLAHGGNQIFMAECQVKHMMLALRDMLENDYRTIEPKQDVHDRYNEKVDELHRDMVWMHPGMTNWYRNRHGRVFAISPWRLVEYWQMTSNFERSDYLTQ